MKDTKPSYESKTVAVNGASILVIWIARQFGVEVPAEIAVTILALINVGLRFLTKGKVVLLTALLAVGLSGVGCARNTNSVNIGGTGLFVEAFGTMIALGNFEVHIATSELADEQFTVTDTKYFEGMSMLEGESGANSTLDTQRVYSMTVSPTEDTTWEE